MEEMVRRKTKIKMTNEENRKGKLKWKNTCAFESLHLEASHIYLLDVFNRWHLLVYKRLVLNGQQWWLNPQNHTGWVSRSCCSRIHGLDLADDAVCEMYGTTWFLSSRFPTAEADKAAAPTSHWKSTAWVSVFWWSHIFTFSSISVLECAISW